MKGSLISWTDNTWNPWIGCTKVSPGCQNCYMFNSPPVRIARAKGIECCGPGNARIVSKNWKAPLQWNREAANNGRNTLVFPSLCDWLDKEIPIDVLAQFLMLIHSTPCLTWQLLTKRPELFFDRMIDCARYANFTLGGGAGNALGDFIEGWIQNQPPRNVWILTSCEDGEWYEKRAHHVLQIPAVVHGVSLEPLLGPIGNLGLLKNQRDQPDCEWSSKLPFFDWVVVGGESGPKARPCDVQWIRDVVKQCKDAKVACFVKQMGSYSYDSILGWKMLNKDAHASDSHIIEMGRLTFKHPKGGNMAEWPKDLQVQQMPNL